MTRSRVVRQQQYHKNVRYVMRCSCDEGVQAAAPHMYGMFYGAVKMLTGSVLQELKILVHDFSCA